MLPAGCLIVLQTPTAERRTAGLLVRLLSRRLQPDSGVCCCLPMLEAELAAGGIEEPNNVMHASLSKNLFGVSTDGGLDTNRHVKDDKLWELCRRVGLSTGLIGAKYHEDWGKIIFKPSSHRDIADFGRILLVRALLQRPDVLCINGLSDFWTRDQQMHLAQVARDYLSGSLDESLWKGTSCSQHRSRTIYWNASDAVYNTVLRPSMVAGDFVLSIHSSKVATIGSPWPEIEAVPPKDGQSELTELRTLGQGVSEKLDLVEMG
eukprot:gnl/TRDRNA2_/TRDRNA2_165424_c0_seq3.p1 gnl/TRDRNA2_/TRDRNA2_165424_c0~~gnl/TRDRNA2_/TRDRNA2_165424_c0_seq3.p1  ORF type:complete len:263 (-),score=34.28 gnl/TRDRNA2_/TRDRNA2_165424_c0_seq3:212-1000(-)